VTLDSGERHAHASSGYNRRRAECAQACELLGVATLREATLEAATRLPAPLDRRARHVITENARVDAAVAALEAGEIERLGSLLDASHASLRDDYEVSTPELDALVAALEDAGALGARLTGAGFGGCVVALTIRGTESEIAGRAASAYRTATGREPAVYVCRAAGGAGPL